MFVLMAIVAVLILPMMAQAYDVLAVGFASGEGADNTEKFALRVLFIVMATIYAVAAIMVLDRFLGNKPVLSDNENSGNVA